MDLELGLVGGGRVGDDADQRAGLQIEPGPRPQRAEHGLGSHVDEIAHHRVRIILLVGPLDELVAEQRPAQCRALAIRLALAHGILPGAMVACRPEGAQP